MSALALLHAIGIRRPPRHLAVAAGVALVHAGGLAALLAMPPSPQAITPPTPIRISLAGPDPQPEPKPQTKPRTAPVPPKAAPVPAAQRTKSPTAARPVPQRTATPATAAIATTAATDSPAASDKGAPSPPASAATAAAPAALPVSAPRFDAAYLDNPAPNYPSLSRRAHEEGRVTLRVLVSASGLPTRVELARSSGFERLDRSAREAVGRWRFVAARQGEQAVEAWVNVPIIFTLQES